MTIHHRPFRIHWRPPQVQVAPLSSSRRKGCTPLLQPQCGSRNRRGTSPSIGSRSLGRVWPCQQASHPLNFLWILALPEKATRPGLVVAAFCSFCNSPCTAQRFHQGWMCGRASLWSTKLAEGIVKIWEAIFRTLLVNVTCRCFQFCILALQPMDAFVHAFKCQRHCGDGAGASRDKMQGGMRFLDHLRAGVHPRVPGAVPWREKYHAAQ